MKYILYLGLLVVLFIPYKFVSASSDLSITITKFEGITSKGGDYSPDQQMLYVTWALQSSIPRRLSLSFDIINADTGATVSIIRPCLKVASDNQCLLEHPENYMTVDPISQVFWQWPIPANLPSGNYKLSLKVFDRNTGYEEARSESLSTVGIISNGSTVQTINSPLVLATYSPRITSLTMENSAEYGGSIKVEWHAVDTAKVNFTLTGPDFGGISGLRIINAQTGQDASLVTQSLDAQGSMYLKIANATALSKKIWVVVDPQSNRTGETINGRKILEIGIPASEVSPKIKSLSPGSGAVGTDVVINGSGFLKANNSVAFETTGNSNSGIEQWNVSSTDGITLKFVVPSKLRQMSEKYGNGTGVYEVVPGKYQVSVSNEIGKSEVYYFTVTAKPPVIVESPSSRVSPNIVANTQSVAHPPMSESVPSPAHIGGGSQVQNNIDTSKKMNQVAEVTYSEASSSSTNSVDLDVEYQAQPGFFQWAFKHIFDWFKK